MIVVLTRFQMMVGNYRIFSSRKSYSGYSYVNSVIPKLIFIIL